jgi:hypothetical protein
VYVSLESLGAAKAEVMERVRSGRIQGVPDRLTAANSGGAFNDRTHPVYLDDGMRYALAALSRANPVSIAK